MLVQLRSVIGSRILDYMQVNGISQRYIVNNSNLSAVAVSLMLRGKQGMYIEDYCEICQALGVGFGYFFEGLEN